MNLERTDDYKRQLAIWQNDSTRMAAHAGQLDETLSFIAQIVGQPYEAAGQAVLRDMGIEYFEVKRQTFANYTLRVPGNPLEIQLKFSGAYPIAFVTAERIMRVEPRLKIIST